MRKDLQISKREKFGYDIIDLNGDITYEDSKKIEEFIKDMCDMNTTDVILNIENVSYINSAALSVLVKVVHEFAKKRVNIYLMNVGEAIIKLIKMTGLNRVFNIIADESSLLENLKEKDLKEILENLD